MTVPSGVLKHKYQGDGSNDQFDYDFKITSKNYVLVQKQVGTSDPVDLTVDIDFSMTGIGNDSGGVITYPLVGTKLAAQEFLIIKPAYPYNQNLQLNALTLPPEDVEDQFDIMCMQIKQVADELSRALQVSEAYDGDVDSFISLITSTSSALIATISGTSTSTLTVGTGSKTFTTQSGKSWVLGQRLRAASDDGTKIMEGQVTAYATTSLTLNVDYTSGSGSHSDWNISLTGARGASGAGSGDLLAANNLSDLANKPTAFDNIKQLATSAATGVARQATNAEALAGLLDNIIISPAALAYVLATVTDDVPPPGTVVDYAGATEPTGWLFCYGQAVDRTTYAGLFAAIGTTFGSGDGSTTFNLPDIRGRVTAGQDDMGGTSANRLTGLSGGVNGDTFGATGGSESHVLLATEMPAHTHNVTYSNVEQAGFPSSRGTAGSGESTRATASAGGGGAHNNVQPTIILNKIIKT
jgi:microcystin-dependent protein